MNNNSLVVVKGNFLNKIDCTPFKTPYNSIVVVNSNVCLTASAIIKSGWCGWGIFTTLEGLQ